MLSFGANYYIKVKLVQSYSGRIYLVSHPKQWDVLDFVRSKVVNRSII